MKINPPITLAYCAELLGLEYKGSSTHLISGINEIHRVTAGDLTFVDVEKYYRKALASAATTILINKAIDPPAGKALLISEDPFADYNRLTEHFQPSARLNSSSTPEKLGTGVTIGENVVFGESVIIGRGVQIGHNVVIGDHVVIGDYTQIHANVAIYAYTQIGRHVVINSGAVIGSEAFYYKKRAYGREKMLSKGRVILGDFVEIGANTTLDRGVSAETIIGEHTKIDNLVHIGHDTIIGKRCVIAAQVGIAGVCTIGDDVILWGQVGVASDITIGDKAVLYAKTGVMSSLTGGKTYFGMVADESRKSLRQLAALQKLTALLPQLEALVAQSELQ
jgi:UDP-3-O-[3-hydroxymyristoyl] glucosamine N-acyltransferase